MNDPSLGPRLRQGAPRTRRILQILAPLGLVVTAACGSSGGTVASGDAGTDARSDATLQDSGSKVDSPVKPDTGVQRDTGKDSAPVDAGHCPIPEAPDAGLPRLAALNVWPTDKSPDAGSGKGYLTPAFSPNVHDYYVRCSAGTNQLSVAMTASSGASCSVTQPPPASMSSPMQTVAVSVDEGALIDVVATDAAGSNDYWIRCLPHDFPGIEMLNYPDAGTPGPGYYLFGSHIVPNGESGYAAVVDGNGVPLWYSKPGGGAPANTQIGNVDSLAPGEVSFIPVPLTTYNPFVVETLTATPPTFVSINLNAGDSGLNYTSDEHELQVMKTGPRAGHYFTFSDELVTGVDLTGLLKFRKGDAALPGPNSTVQDCSVLEIDPTKTTGNNVVWTWSALAHFDPVKVTVHPTSAQGPVALQPGGADIYDLFHCTSIDIDPANGNLLVASRQMDSVFYVEYPSGRVLWKMGGLDGSKDSPPPTYVHLSAVDHFDEEHDARLLPGWDQNCNGGTGQISMMDDESMADVDGGLPPRGIIYDVVVGGGDAGACSGAPGFDGGAPPAGMARASWQYNNLGAPGCAPAQAALTSPIPVGASACEGHTGGGGNLRISCDNTRMLGWGVGSPVFTEVDVHGNQLRVFRFTSGDVSYRALKVPLTQFDPAMLRANAGK